MVTGVSMNNAAFSGNGTVRRHNNNGLPDWLKILLVSVAGTGIGTNAAWNYVNREDNLNQYRQAASLEEKLANLNTQLGGMTALERQLANLNAQLGGRVTLDQIVSSIAQITPSTVRVEGANGLGSGVIIIGSNGERLILTNGHVTQANDFRDNEFMDGVYHVKVYNGSDYKNPIEFSAAPVILSNGKRAYSDPNEHDLAILFIPPDVKLPEGIGVKMRDIKAHPLQVGEPVFAVGNPFGEKDTVTIGSISHVDRASNLNINHHIQTDAAINPGNSGGGLFSLRVENGKPVVELIGINTWGYRGADDVGGSIRVDFIQQVLKDWGIALKS